VREESGHLSVKVRGINVESLSTSACVKCLSLDTGTRRKRGNIDTSNFNRQMTTHFFHLTLSVKVRGIDVVSLSTSACVK
jgi:hypothetical protein